MEPWCSCWIATPIPSARSERTREKDMGQLDRWKAIFVQIELLVHGIWRLEGKSFTGKLNCMRQTELGERPLDMGGKSQGIEEEKDII